ncbi:unnamed protein product [Effrenium voratum]|uniref:Uncharacterized protein n=1 Tax=Effrenium voratum TaxID=2562239 RepID=A0AA36J585_9DINO|nr:unnamed protein product [Effrenium voratum]CAJ1442854.1 unnamed protein product [Effrenium voratum]
MTRVAFCSLEGEQVEVKPLGGQLQCALNGVWQLPCRHMTFEEDGTVEWPELSRKVRVEADGRRAELQELACFAGIGVKFQEVRSHSTVRVSLCGGGRLQYTCDGAWRPPFQYMEFVDNLVVFPEIHHSAQLPAAEAPQLRQLLQALAVAAGCGMSFAEARGKGCLRMTVAGPGKLQYTVDGKPRPGFSQMYFEGQFVHFPELGTTAKLPKEAKAARVEMQQLACRASLGVDFEEARGHGRVRVTCADDYYLQYTVDGVPRPLFQQMLFDAAILDVPDLGKSVHLPRTEAKELRIKLQDMACRVRLGVRFLGARGERMVRFHLAKQRLQYTVDGALRPPLSHMIFQEDGVVFFPELQKTVKLLAKEAEPCRILLQELAVLAGLGVRFVEGRGKDCIRIHLADEGLIQYTVNGAWRPCFSQVEVNEDGWLELPELGRKARLPHDQVFTVRSELRDLLRAEGTPPAEPAGTDSVKAGPACWLVVEADSVQMTAAEE